LATIWPNHRIHGLKANELSFGTEGDLGFGSVFRYQSNKLGTVQEIPV